MKTIVQVAALSMPLLALAACRSGYDVDVRNLADQPVVASIVTTHANGGGQLMASQRLGPGDRTGLFAETDTKDTVWLEVDFAGNTGYPARLDLVRGRTVVNVHRADEGSKGKLKLEEVPRP
jgi:hypothetical protein